MSRFQKGDVVYRPWLAEWEGGLHPIALLGTVLAVCPQRDGTTEYHVRNFAGESRGGVWTTFNVPAADLYRDPLQAMTAAVGASRVLAASANPPTRESS